MPVSGADAEVRTSSGVRLTEVPAATPFPRFGRVTLASAPRQHLAVPAVSTTQPEPLPRLTDVAVLIMVAPE